MKAKEDKEKKNTEKDVRAAPTSTEESEEWLKKLGAVPADRHFEESPEIARIQATLSSAEQNKPTDTTTEQKDFAETMAEWLCHHLTPTMLREQSDKRLDIICPAKEYLARAKIWFKETLTQAQTKMAVRPQYLPCHLCPKYYKAGQERPKTFRLRNDQVQFLREFDLWEVRPVSQSAYVKKTNFSRKRTAQTLEKLKLIQIAYRFFPNPNNPKKPEPTLTATLSVLGLIASGKAPESIKENPSKALLNKPNEVTAVYVETLRVEIERLKPFIQTKQDQRTPAGQIITLENIDLQRQFDFFMQYDSAKS
ncbi:MAG: hypothetical protein ACE5MK_09100 [Acidobacteriota bacterium]